LSFLRSKRGVAVVAVVFLLALFLVRPGADRLKSRITRSISLELKRSVDIGSVSLRLLPTPGFDLKNFVLYDDQAFGAEPMMQAAEVTANLRVASLLRGRLEIARLNLTEPSINLVRNNEGHWNLESLLERAAKNPMAPTGKEKSQSQSKPSFPYVEADNGRINLKIGQEKKSYALTNADFSFWQDTDNTWAMRLNAQPVRTDFNLSDTGVLKMNGTWQRASNLRDTPVQFTMQWSDAQLGQLTKLIYGKDKGWRGEVKLAATLAGSPGDLTIATDASVQDFRRYDILGGDALRLQAACNGHYSTAEKNLTNLACRAPVGEGALTLAGAVNGLPSLRAYDLTLVAENIPVLSVAGLVVHAKKDMPQDLTASGKLNANIRLQQENGEAEWSGGGEALGFKMGSQLNDTELSLSRIPFTVTGVSENDEGGAENRIDMGPVNLPLGRPTSTAVHAQVSRTGYNLTIQGDTQIKKLLQLARTVGLRTPQVAADGGAKIDLQVAGGWSGFSPPVVSGKAVLHVVRGEVRGMNAPIEIASGTIVLTPNNINVLYLAASVGDSAWKGAVAMPRPCVPPDACPVHFDLRVDRLATDELSQILSPNPGKRPWYKFLSPSPQSGTPYLLTLQASGKLAVNRVEIHGLTALHVSGSVEANQGKLRITALRGDVLGGKHAGEWHADFTGKSPDYGGSGTFERVALAQLGEAMHDPWISGTANVNWRATASGQSASELFASASANLEVEAHDGALTHVALPNSAGPLRMRSLAGHLVLRHGLFDIKEGKLETPTGIYQVSGTASLGRVLDVKLVRDGAHGFNISGTITEPRVKAAVNPETQAALKP